jgi:hypothetical protein
VVETQVLAERIAREAAILPAIEVFEALEVAVPRQTLLEYIEVALRVG